jgi:hypothetical protein
MQRWHCNSHVTAAASNDRRLCRPRWRSARFHGLLWPVRALGWLLSNDVRSPFGRCARKTTPHRGIQVTGTEDTPISAGTIRRLARGGVHDRTPKRPICQPSDTASRRAVERVTSGSLSSGPKVRQVGVSLGLHPIPGRSLRDSCVVQSPPVASSSLDGSHGRQGLGPFSARFAGGSGARPINPLTIAASWSKASSCRNHRRRRDLRLFRENLNKRIEFSPRPVLRWGR